MRIFGKRQNATARPATVPLRIASWNLENFGDEPEKTASKASRIAWALVNDLQAPHILAVQKMCDDSGHRNDGVTTAQRNAQTLIDAIQMAGGPAYRYIEVPPTNNNDGGKPGSNIRNGFFYRPDRVALAADSGNDPRTGMLPSNPMRLAVASTAFMGTRKPLIAQFADLKTDELYTMVNVHLASDGTFYRQNHGILSSKGPSSEWVPNPERLGKREEQARIVANTIQQLRGQLAKQGQNEHHHFVVCGDFNTATRVSEHGIKAKENEMPEVLRSFMSAGLINTSGTLAADSFSHAEGQLRMTLDYMFFSPELHARTASVICPALNRHESRATRISDHNPLMASITAPKRAIAPTSPGRGS